MGQINIRETGETYLLLQKIASLKGVNVSEIIRDAIRSSIPGWLHEAREAQRKKLPYAMNPAQVDLETENLAHELRAHDSISIHPNELFTAKSLALYKFLNMIWAEDVGEITESQREKWVKQLGVKVNLKPAPVEDVTEEELQKADRSKLEGRTRRKIAK